MNALSRPSLALLEVERRLGREVDTGGRVAKLASNAAIEAALAGEQGRGFAVVAADRNAAVGRLELG